MTFLHRIVSGAADRSYGIHVAELAGLPDPVIRRARTILERLESGAGAGDASDVQLGLFGWPPVETSVGEDAPVADRAGGSGAAVTPAEERAVPQSASVAIAPPDPDLPRALRLLRELRDTDPDRLRPIEALELLDRWRRAFDDHGSRDDEGS